MNFNRFNRFIESSNKKHIKKKNSFFFFFFNTKVEHWIFFAYRNRMIELNRPTRLIYGRQYVVIVISSINFQAVCFGLLSSSARVEIVLSLEGAHFQHGHRLPVFIAGIAIALLMNTFSFEAKSRTQDSRPRRRIRRRVAAACNS